MIVAEHLRKTFPGTGKGKPAPVVAVDDVGFEARDGEITGLLGPNGAGKTTTLRMLYTLMHPESGRVLVDGHDVASDPEYARRALGVLPDARGVYKRLTARENIRYFGELHGMAAPLIAERTRQLAAALQMEIFHLQRSGELSRALGNQRRGHSVQLTEVADVLTRGQSLVHAARIGQHAECTPRVFGI